MANAKLLTFVRFVTRYGPCVLVTHSDVHQTGVTRVGDLHAVLGDVARVEPGIFSCIDIGHRGHCTMATASRPPVILDEIRHRLDSIIYREISTGETGKLREPASDVTRHKVGVVFFCSIFPDGLNSSSEPL